MLISTMNYSIPFSSPSLGILSHSSTNSSTERIDEFNINQNLQVALIFVVSILTTVGNVFLFVTFAFSSNFGRDKHAVMFSKTSVVDMLIASASAVCVIRVTIRGYIQAMCITQGSWNFGDALCQIQGFMDSILRHLFLWYLTILTLERYTKYRKHHEYAVTFSSMNVKVILPGLFLMITAQATGPIYGWGEYRYLTATGACDLSPSSRFGNSYLAYTLTSLTLPPFIILLSVWSHILAKGKTGENHVEEKDMPAISRSKLLDSQKEIPIFFLLVVGIVMLSAPRLLVEMMLVLNFLTLSESSPLVFVAHFIENVVGLYFAFVILFGHSVPWKVRRYLITNSDWTATSVVKS